MGMRLLHAALVLLASLAGTAGTAAQDYPQRTVQIIVSYPAGSPPDVIARMVAAGMQERFKQTVVVEARSGGGGNIGAALVAKAKPDGYTLLVSANGPVAINRVLYEKMPYDSERDLAPISLLVSAPLVLVVDPNLPIKSFSEFLAYARANPNKVSYATTGIGSAVHLTMELLRTRQTLDVVHVPYRGSADALKDMIAGRIQGMFAIASGVVSQVKAGRLRALAVTSAKRLPALPDVPTIVELGHPELVSAAWIGLLAPGKTPAPIIARLAQAAAATLKDPATVAKLQQQGYEVVADTPVEFQAFIRGETEKWAVVIKQVGAKVK